MPERDWRCRPARYNASISRYSKEGVHVLLIQPKGAPSFVIARSTWGPGLVVETKPGEEPNLEEVRCIYLHHHPSPPDSSRGLSVYERLRRPAL